MGRTAACLLLVCVLVSLSGRAEANPGAAAVRKAASEFDAGSVAYRSQRWELSASHFEAADEAVPSGQALRMAMRARQQAGQVARASTHAAQALDRYANHATTVALAADILQDHASELHRLEVSCHSPCVVALGTRTVPGQPRAHWTVYLAPGAVTVSASFVDGAGSDQASVNGVAGGRNQIRFSAPTAPVPAAASAPSFAPSEKGPSNKTAPIDESGSGFLESPVIFGLWVAATAGVGAVTIWSGVDTIKDPGAEAVRAACKGQGTDCVEFQAGRQKQLRTNVLIGATAGTAAIAAIFGLFVTDWGGGGDDAAALVPHMGPRHGGLQLNGRF